MAHLMYRHWYATFKDAAIPRRLSFLSILAGLVLLTACGIPPQAAEQEAPRAVNVVAMLERSGGLADTTASLWVGADGEATLTSAGDTGDETGRPPFVQLSPDEVTALQQAVTSAEWQQLEERYGQPTPDGFTYTIIAGDKEVTTYDGAPNPPILDTVLRQLQAIWQRAETEGQP
jgi:hypothetical protein